MILQNRLTWFFTPPMRFAGGFLCIAGIIPIFFGEYSASALFIIGIGIISLHSGIFIDTDRKIYKLYYKIFWVFTFGEYHSFESISAINLKTKKLAYSTFSRSNRQIKNRFTHYLVSAILDPSGKELPLFMSKSQTLAATKVKEFESLKSQG